MIWGIARFRLTPRAGAALFAGLAAAAVLWPGAALAVKPISITPDTEKLEITALEDVDLYESRGDSLQVDAALGPDGTSGRMSVRATTPDTEPNWLVFALTNATDKAIERWLTAERYNVIGSGAVWPDLDARRVEAVTPSIGFVPERVKNDRADVFRVTLEPGQTITYVAELAPERIARVYLWKPLDYELKIRERQLFNGIMLGLTGLLAIFLTVIFAANHKMIFPAAALVAWCVLAYLCVDFGFFHKLFQLRPEDNAVYRAAGEAAMAASLVIFLHTFLKLTLGHGLVRMLVVVWMLAQLALVAVAVIDPKLAATFARCSFVLIGATGAAFILYLALKDQDRALSLVPTWIIFLVWIFGAAVTLSGRLAGDIVASGLVAGLVMVVLLIGLTVTQFAFRSRETAYGAAPSEAQTRALAVDGAGCGVWEWSGRRGEIKVSPLIEATLGLHPGELNAKVEEFVKHLHPSDHERFNLMLWSIQERSGGRIRSDFRMRHADGNFRWFELEASSMPGADPRALRCVGLLRETTEAKLSRERLLRDAVYDSLTGLPNRALFLDRLAGVVMRAKTDSQLRPTVLYIDIDRFKNVNRAIGVVKADSLLLFLARRLQQHVGPHDTLARAGPDQFAVLLVAEKGAQEIASLAERVRRSIRSPMKINDQEIVLTGSIGIAVYDRGEDAQNDLMKEAEIAMHRAKRHGADRIELFRPDMRGDADERAKLEEDLRKALEKNQVKILYQPVMYLATEELAGFETTLRWDHPKNGPIDPESVARASEGADLAVKVGAFAIRRACEDAAKWGSEHARADGRLYVGVNVASAQLLRPELVQEIRNVFSRSAAKGTLRLEIAEPLIMENPEQAIEVLELLKGAGADLALDCFGTCYSSIADLQRFPFDTFKIDRAIVQASGSGDAAGVAMLRSMVALAHELGRKVVADGVETAEEIGFLRSIGCDYAQGIFYSDPMPENEVLNLLKVVRLNDRKRQPNSFFRHKAKKARREPDPLKLAAPAPRGAGAAGDGAASAARARASPSNRANGAGARPQPPPAARPLAGAQQRPRGAARAPAASEAEQARGRAARGGPARGAGEGGMGGRPERFAAAPRGAPPSPPPLPQNAGMPPPLPPDAAPLPSWAATLTNAGAAPPEPRPPGVALDHRLPDAPWPSSPAREPDAPPPLRPPEPEPPPAPRPRAAGGPSSLPPSISESLRRLAGEAGRPPASRPKKNG